VVSNPSTVVTDVSSDTLGLVVVVVVAQSRAPSSPRTRVAIAAREIVAARIVVIARREPPARS
jgi:hypothetical protein